MGHLAWRRWLEGDVPTLDEIACCRVALIIVTYLLCRVDAYPQPLDLHVSHVSLSPSRSGPALPSRRRPTLPSVPHDENSQHHPGVLALRCSNLTKHPSHRCYPPPCFSHPVTTTHIQPSPSMHLPKPHNLKRPLIPAPSQHNRLPLFILMFDKIAHL